MPPFRRNQPTFHLQNGKRFDRNAIHRTTLRYHPEDTIIITTALKTSDFTKRKTRLTAGWAFKVAKLRPLMITNYFLNYFHSQGQTAIHTTIHGRLAKVVNQLITFTFQFVTLTLKKYNHVKDNYIIEMYLFSIHEHNIYMVICSDLYMTVRVLLSCQVGSSDYQSHLVWLIVSDP